MSSPFDEPGAVTPAWLREVPLAHRGLHGQGVPENSLSAFEAASAAGYGVELDVHLSADGQPVVIHDASLERVAGLAQRVGDLPAAELKELRLGDSGEGVPSLEAVLRVLTEVPVMVELKSRSLRPGRLEAAVVEVLAAHPGPFCIASFNPVSLRWIRRTHPELVRVLTATAVGLGGLSAPLGRRLADLRDLESVAPAAVSYDILGLPRPAVDLWRERGGAVLAWTVDGPETLARAAAHADNIIFEHVRPEPALPGPDPVTSST